ncbi:hypothetical protein [Psychromarinibacter sp. S121]|uniref:hypothetical protein n=1 Tax=Psychromarinibacter sp. S121 TaxID=3415127 RepID=UPI003C7DC4D8
MPFYRDYSTTAGRGFARVAATGALLALATAAQADFVINDDLIVDGSACIGFDCVNGESFSFDTIRLKENNLRIKFDDTSVAGSYPRNDWELLINDSVNGGQSKFSIRDVSGNRTPFTIEAAAPSHSLYVDDGGRLGVGTSTPSVELHVVDGDTPTLRLQQDGSSGFAPQTWDVAGNETNFFVRDVTNGSTLPLRIFPDSPSGTLVVRDGNVGVGGVTSPEDDLHVYDNDGTATLRLDDGSTDDDVLFTLSGDKLFITFADTIGSELTIRQNGQVEVGLGNLEVNNGHDLVLSGGGSVVVNGTTLNVPDYVFAPDYNLMPLTELAAFIETNSHLPGVPSAGDVNAGGLDMTAMQMALLEKVEELTLYTLEQQAALDEVHALRARVDELEGLLATR